MLYFPNDSKKNFNGFGFDLDTSIGVVQPEDSPCGVFATILWFPFYFSHVKVN